MSIESLLTTKVIEAVKQCYDADVDKDKVQLQATRKEFAGDLTVVVFPFTRFSKKSPEETGKELGGYLKQHIEEIKDYNVVKGFLNIEISAAYWLGVLNEVAQDPKYGYVHENSGHNGDRKPRKHAHTPVLLRHARNKSACLHHKLYHA